MKKIMPIIMIALLAGKARADADPRDFQWIKRLISPESTTNSVAVCEMDEEMLRDIDDNYANIRVFNDSEKEVPFAIRTKQRKKIEMRECEVETKETSFKELPDNMAEIALEQVKTQNKPLAKPCALTISTRIKNYEKNIMVSGSNDGKMWEVIVENQPIFDYSRFIDVRNNRVNLNSEPYKFYKIIISNISEKQQSPIVNIARDMRESEVFSELEETSFRREDFRIEKITLLTLKPFEVKTSVVTREYTVENLKVAHDAKDKKSIVTFSTGNMPVSEIIVVTSSSNFSRAIRVEGLEKSGSSETWRRMTIGNISRIKMGQFERDNVSVSIPSAKRFRDYRLTIENMDSPALDIDGIKIIGPVQELVFPLEPNKKYRAFYGGINIDSPRYDITDVLRKTDGETAGIYSPEAREPNPAFEPNKGKHLMDSKKFLVIAIVIMVAVLLWVIAGSGKKINAEYSDS